MTWISSLFSRYVRNVHIGLATALAVVLIVDISPVNSIVSHVATTVFYEPFSMARNAIVELTDVNQENERLRERLLEASVRLARLEEARKENVRLRSILGFTPPAGYRLMPAQVLSVTGNRLPISAVINRGLRDSVFVNQPVINEQGLIGRVRDVSPGFATVQLLTDPANRVAARVSESREMGIIKYARTEGMILDNFPVQGDIAPQREIVSSGLGGVYPPGLLIGYVESVEREPEEAFCRVKVRPVANFSSLEELFLLTPEEP
jgi:rod shape-determining protein MreC